MSRTPGSGWGAGPLLYQKCPCCGKKKAIYNPIPEIEYHKPFRCLACKERFDSIELISKRYASEINKQMENKERKILVIMQNMWVENPDNVKRMIERWGKNDPDYWNKICKRFLFMGCATGKRIKSAFGDLTDKMIFDESTTEIADSPKTIFKADLKHISDTIKRIEPFIIITFGKIAGNALMEMYQSPAIYYHSTPLANHTYLAPHPTARQADTMKKIKIIAANVKIAMEQPVKTAKYVSPQVYPNPFN